MKMRAVFFVTVCTLCAMFVQAQPAESTRVEISGVFTRQSGAASNQYAVWIEDSSGTFVRTLYVTWYTAKGGWKVRAQSIPLWVKQSGISALRDSDIDVFTSATPKTGTVSYIWNGTDSAGKPVKPGTYRVYMEASLRWADRVVYTAEFTVGEGSQTAGAVPVAEKYYGENGEISGSKIPKEHSMISGIQVNIKK